MDAESDLPDPDVIYGRTVETCRRMGIEPPSREHVQVVNGWNLLILDGPSDASTMQ